MVRGFENMRLGAAGIRPLDQSRRAMKKENRAQPRKLVCKVSGPRVIAKSGWHKARRIILTENAGAVIERKLGWIK